MIKYTEQELDEAKTTTLLTLECDHCHSTIMRKKKIIIEKNTQNHFCNSTCSSTHYSNSIIKPCKNCNKEVKRTQGELKKVINVFCSISCSATYNNKAFPKKPPAIKYYCKCGTSMRKNSKVCSKCVSLRSSDIKTKSLKQYTEMLSLKGKHPSWAMAHVRLFNRSWNKNLTELPCQFCKYEYHTELCHIKPVSSYDDNATLGEINDPSNILVLCPNHHYEFDSGKLALNEITPRI